MKKSDGVGLLVEVLEHAYVKRSWHGTNLRGSVRGLDVETALWRPAVGRHNIYELVLHTAYWKYAVRRRLTAEKRGSFPNKGSNWFPAPESASAAEWREAVDLLNEEHRALMAAVTARPEEAMTRRELVYGVAAHDLYHAGQIQLLKRLQAK